jgi:multisubunit Na+/H+ antiporter MnhF subunit
VNVWLVAAVSLLVGVIPCAVVLVRDDLDSALVALQLGGLLVAEVLLLVAVGADRSPYADVALVLAVLSLPAGLVFARFLEGWR